MMDAATPLLPLADWVNAIVNGGAGDGSPALLGVGDALARFGEAVQAMLAWLPAWGLVALVAALGAWRGGWRLAVQAAVALGLIHAMGFGAPLVVTLAQVITATTASVLLGVPLGVWLGTRPLASRLARPLLDLMQTLPAFVYLIPATMLFGLGLAPALLATVVFALPPVVRLTALGMRQVPRDIVEAATTLGATRLQVLCKVRLPAARAALLAGVSQTVMMALSMVIIASMVGAGGLGNEVLSAIQRLDVGQGLASGLCVVLLAIVVDRLSESFGTAASSS